MHIALVSGEYAGYVDAVDGTHLSQYKILGNMMTVGNLCLDKKNGKAFDQMLTKKGLNSPNGLLMFHG